MPRLPSLPPLLRDEALDSYLERCAALLDAPVRDVLHACGLTRGHRPVAHWGVWIFDTDRDHVQDSLAIEPATLLRMTLRRWETHLRAHPTPIDDVHALRHLAFSRWLYLAGSRYCPHCVSEQNGGWRVSWRLALAPVCPTHRVILRTACPACSAWPRSGTGRSVSSRTFLTTPRDSVRCYSSEPAATRGVGRGSQPCLADLTDASSEPATEVMIDAQRALLSLLDSPDDHVALLGRAMSTYEAILSWQQLCALLLRHNLQRRPGNQHKDAIPRDAAAVADALATAHHVLGSEDRAAASAAMAEVLPEGIDVNWCRDRIPQQATASLADLLASVLRDRGRYSTRFRRATAEDPTLPLYRFTASQLPQLFWTCSLPDVLLKAPGKVSVPMRAAFVTLSLARLLHGGWDAAAAALGWPPFRGNAWRRYVIGYVPVAQRPDLFREVMALAQNLQAAPPTLDFSSTRSSAPPATLGSDQAGRCVHDGGAWCPRHRADAETRPQSSAVRSAIKRRTTPAATRTRRRPTRLVATPVSRGGGGVVGQRAGSESDG